MAIMHNTSLTLVCQSKETMNNTTKLHMHMHKLEKTSNLFKYDVLMLL